MQLIKLFLSTILCCMILDITWLGLIAKNLYDKNIGFLLRKSGDSLTPNWSAAMFVYFAIATGIICFVLPKANENYFYALVWGAVFGAVTYGIYDFTNLAVLANWPLKISIIDVVWGMFICGVTSVFAVFMQHWLNA